MTSRWARRGRSCRGAILANPCLVGVEAAPPSTSDSGPSRERADTLTSIPSSMQQELDGGAGPRPARTSSRSLTFLLGPCALAGLASSQDSAPWPQRTAVHPSGYSEVLESIGRERPHAKHVDSYEEVAEAAALATKNSDDSTAPYAMTRPVSRKRIAVRHAESDADAALRAFARAGVTVEHVNELRPGWTMVTAREDVVDARGLSRAAAEIAAADGVTFVAPVLESDGGWAVPTGSLFVALRGDTTLSPEDLVEGRSELSVAEENFAGIPGVVRLECATKLGADVVARTREFEVLPGVAWAEPELILSASAAYIPNDPGFSQLWGFRSNNNIDMDVDTAWDITQGDPGVRVLVLDTGTAVPHPDLNEALRADFTATSLNGCDNHGTPVAGCITARIDNSLGTVGVAPRCSTLSARVFVSASACDGSGTVTNSHFAAALDWGRTEGARVSNTSLQINPPSSVISNALANARAAGMVHFASAGNNSAIGSVYPGSLSTVHEVAAITQSGALASFSNRSDDVICAPGVSIYSTDRPGGFGYTTGDYVTTQGTSFSSPYVAGIAALMISVFPTIQPDEIEAILRQTATDLGSSGRDTTFGWGLANAQRAVLEARTRYQACQFSLNCHPTTQGYGSGFSAFLGVCSQSQLSCPGAVSIILQGAPANQAAWLILADQLQPTALPGIVLGQVVDPTPITILSVATDGNGTFCLPNVSNCGQAPLFLQMLWTRPNQSTLGASEIVRMDFGPLAKYEVGPNRMFGRIQDAINAAAYRMSTFGAPPVEVDSGTYNESLQMLVPVSIYEAAGATAVLRGVGSMNHLVRAASWPASGFGGINGIDIVLDGNFTSSPIVVDARGSANIQFHIQNLSITDVPGVTATNAPVVLATDDAGSSRATVYMGTVDVNAVHAPYGPLLRVDGTSQVTWGSASSSQFSPPGLGATVITSAENFAEVRSTSVPGLDISDLRVEQTQPREELLVTSNGIIYSRRNTFVLPTNSIGVGRIEGATDAMHLFNCLVEARNGSQNALFRMVNGGHPGLSFRDTAVVFDAANTGNHTVLDAPLGGSIYIEQSTITSTSSHAEATIVSGPRTKASPSVASYALTGRVHKNVFVLPGTNQGVITGQFGQVVLEHMVENIRHTPGGFAGRDWLTGIKHDVDPVLAADGFHLTATSPTVKRFLGEPSSLDIDGQLRVGIGVHSTNFGCDHTTPTFQTGRHVGVGHPHATIQSAIQAALPGETIIVHAGTYNERIAWNKPVNIEEAWGESAVLNCTTTAGGLYVIQQLPWPSGAHAYWDGVDVLAASTVNDVIDLRGTTGSTPVTVEFRNMRFSDGGTLAGAPRYFNLDNNTSGLWIRNTTIDPQVHFYGAGFYAGNASHVSVNDSYVSFRATQTARCVAGGQVDFNDCRIVDRGSEILSVDGNSSVSTLYRSMVTTKVNRGTTTVGFLGAGACRIGIHASYVDARNGCATSPIYFSTQNAGNLDLSNSAIVYHSGRTMDQCVIRMPLGGNVSMLHNTIRNVQDEAQYLQFARAILGPASAGAVLSGSFHANLFDLPGSNLGALTSAGGSILASGSGSVVHVGAGTGLWDVLPGPRFNVDPLLGSDGVHLTAQSTNPALRAALIRTSQDIDGDQRPGSGQSAPNHGCDELAP